MDVLRTPDECFDSVAPLFPYKPRYTEVPFGDDYVRVHFVDEGPRHAPVVLMLHGEPSWSFLYRKVIARVTAAGFRAIAPDLVGFGRSDKPVSRDDYTYQRHVDSMAAFLAICDLQEATLLCQDWGGLIGLRLIAEHGHRFARIVAANTSLPTGDKKPHEAFFAWRQFSQQVPQFPVGKIVKSACVVPPSPEVIAAYDAPFPDESYKAGARQFPMLVPLEPDGPAAAPNRLAWEALEKWEKPFHTAFSDSDPVTSGGDIPMRKRIPGARKAEQVTVTGAGHFLQEDKGEILGDLVAGWMKAG